MSTRKPWVIGKTRNSLEKCTEDNFECIQHHKNVKSFVTVFLNREAVLWATGLYYSLWWLSFKAIQKSCLLQIHCILTLNISGIIKRQEFWSRKERAFHIWKQIYSYSLGSIISHQVPKNGNPSFEGCEVRWMDGGHCYDRRFLTLAIHVRLVTFPWLWKDIIMKAIYRWKNLLGACLQLQQASP